MGSVMGRGGEPGGLSMEEVAKHRSKDDAWIVLFGEAIEVTSFIPIHPGGEASLMLYLGKDATTEWQQIHRPETLDEYMQHLVKMGKVDVRGGLMSWLLGLGRRGGQKPGSEASPQGEDMGGSEPGPPAPGRERLEWGIEHEAELPPGGSFDLQELSRWDGVQLPMCIGICGLVVDVSSSSNFVPDFGYGKLWAGKDTTLAMAMVSLKAEDANRFDFKLDELSEDHFKALAGWYKHFKEKYRTVGTLRELRGWDFSSVEKAAEALPKSKMSQPENEREDAADGLAM